MDNIGNYSSIAKLLAQFDELSRMLDESLGDLAKLSKTKLYSEERHQKCKELRDVIIKSLDGLEDLINDMDSSRQVPDYTIKNNIQICNSYKTVFQRLDDEINEKIQRELLFYTPNSSSSRSAETGTNYALEEFESARRATSLVDRQIEIAMDVRNDLSDQQTLLGRSQWKLLDTNTRYQTVNNLVHRIALRKRRDQYIVGCVIVLGFIGLLMLAT